jgi:hypothetical protein
MKIRQKNQTEITITITVSITKAKYILRWLEEVLSWIEPEKRNG